MDHLEDIDQETLNILKETIDPCVFIFFEDILTVINDPNHPKQNMMMDYSDEATPHIVVKGSGPMRTVQLHGWSQVMQNILGLSFTDTYEMAVRDIGNTNQILFRGKVEGGPGKRLLFQALGSRTLTCRASFPENMLGSDVSEYDETSITFDPEVINIDFYAGSSAYPETILTSLRSARLDIAKRLDLSMIKGDYTPFRAWAGKDTVTGEIKYAATDKFNELFDQGEPDSH